VASNRYCVAPADVPEAFKNEREYRHPVARWERLAQQSRNVVRARYLVEVRICLRFDCAICILVIISQTRHALENLKTRNIFGMASWRQVCKLICATVNRADAHTFSFSFLATRVPDDVHNMSSIVNQGRIVTSRK
jgi:hypothetical protein